MKSVGYCFHCQAWLTADQARQSAFGKRYFCLTHGTTLRVTDREIRDIEQSTGQKAPKE